jgi:hypothetical protein
VPGLTVSVSSYFGCVLRERDVVPAFPCDAEGVSLFTASLLSCTSVLALLSPLLTRTVSAGAVFRGADCVPADTGAAASVDADAVLRECEVVAGAAVTSVEPAVTVCGRCLSDRRASDVVPLDTGAAVSVLRSAEVVLLADVPVDVFRGAVAASRADRGEESTGVCAGADGDSDTLTSLVLALAVSDVGTLVRAGRRGCSAAVDVVPAGPVTGVDASGWAAFLGRSTI